jgi:hypothetical protein
MWTGLFLKFWVTEREQQITEKKHKDKGQRKAAYNF